MALGFIYVLSNPDMPGLVKIGQSKADPDLRAAELHATGVPSPFVVQYKGLFEGYVALEQRVHLELDGYRHSKSREFFRINVETAIDAIRGASGTPPKYEDTSFVSDAVLKRQSRQREARETRRRNHEAHKVEIKNLWNRFDRLPRLRSSVPSPTLATDFP